MSTLVQSPPSAQELAAQRAALEQQRKAASAAAASSSSSSSSSSTSASAAEQQAMAKQAVGNAIAAAQCAMPASSAAAWSSSSSSMPSRAARKRKSGDKEDDDNEDVHADGDEKKKRKKKTKKLEKFVCLKIGKEEGLCLVDAATSPPNVGKGDNFICHQWNGRFIRGDQKNTGAASMALTSPTGRDIVLVGVKMRGGYFGFVVCKEVAVAIPLKDGSPLPTLDSDRPWYKADCGNLKGVSLRSIAAAFSAAVLNKFSTKKVRREAAAPAAASSSSSSSATAAAAASSSSSSSATAAAAASSSSSSSSLSDATRAAAVAVQVANAQDMRMAMNPAGVLLGPVQRSVDEQLPLLSTAVAELRSAFVMLSQQQQQIQAALAQQQQQMQAMAVQHQQQQQMQAMAVQQQQQHQLLTQLSPYNSRQPLLPTAPDVSASHLQQDGSQHGDGSVSALTSTSSASLGSSFSGSGAFDPYAPVTPSQQLP